MKKKMLVIAMAAIVGVSAFPMAGSAKAVVTKLSQAEDEFEEEEEYEEEVEGEGWDEEDEDEEAAGELTKGDIMITPAKKTIKIGKSFYIGVAPSDEVEEIYADMPDEEWEELVEESIDGITYRSSRSAVASVSKSGKVKGRKKGSAVITTTVSFSDGSEGSYKTKVYVTR